MARQVVWHESGFEKKWNDKVACVNDGINKIENDIEKLKTVTLDLDHRVDALEHKAPKSYYLRVKKGRDQVVVKLG